MGNTKMMNQFSAIYGQLFCCGCPGGLASVRCDNKTGMIIYPVIANSYAWLAGILSLVVIALAVAVAAVIYCKKRRESQNTDTISIIRFHDALLPRERNGGQARGPRGTSSTNQGYTEPEPADVGGSQPGLASWASEESLECPFLSHADTSDVISECGDTRALTSACQL